MCTVVRSTFRQENLIMAVCKSSGSINTEIYQHVVGCSRFL